MQLLLTGKFFHDRTDFVSWLKKSHSTHLELDHAVIFDLLDNPNYSFDAIILDEHFFSSTKQSIEFAWGLHRNFPEIPTIMIISPRDSYENIFEIYQKGGLFDVIERYQIDSKSQFTAFKAILFRIEQSLKRNNLIKRKLEDKINKLSDEVELAKSEIPELNKLVEQNKPYKDNIAFISFAFDSKESLNYFLAKRRFNYLVFPDTKNYISDSLHVHMYPTHILLDKKGKIVTYVNDVHDLKLELEKLKAQVK